jgi:hypothetical protein
MCVSQRRIQRARRSSLAYGSYFLGLVVATALCERDRARLAAIVAGAAAAVGTAAIALAPSAAVLGIGVATAERARACLRPRWWP